MRQDSINKVIFYVDIIIRKRTMETEVRAGIIENLAALFRTVPERINLVLTTSKEDITSSSRPVVIFSDGQGSVVIALDLTQSTKYTAEEIVAVMIHDMIHNLATTTLKTRVISAFYHIIENISTGIENSDSYGVLKFMNKQISMNPFSNFIMNPEDEVTFISGDEFLITYELSNAWNQAMYKFHDISKDLWSAMGGRGFDEFNKKEIQNRLDSDIELAKSIGRHYKSRELWSWMDSLDEELDRNGIVFSSRLLARNGFTSSAEQGHRDEPTCCVNESVMLILNESFKLGINPTDLRYQMDRIILSANYIDTEDEKVFVLMKIRNLTKNLNDADEDLSKSLIKNPSDKESQARQKIVQASLSELERLRTTVVSKPIVPKKYSLWIEVPAGYEG